MFNKAKCKKCKYHGRGFSGVVCYYSVYKNKSCLYRDGKEVKDRRGRDPNECLLFEKGEQDKRQLII